MMVPGCPFNTRGVKKGPHPPEGAAKKGPPLPEGAAKGLASPPRVVSVWYPEGPVPPMG